MSASIRLAPHALLLAVALPLAAGAVLGYVVRGAMETPVEVPEEVRVVGAPKATPNVAPSDAALSAAQANVESLRARVAQLEKLLDEREGNLARLASEAAQAQEAAVAKPAEETEAPARQQRPRESFRERMERMKTEEPERYAEMQKRQTEFRARMHADNEERGNFFASIDTTRMTADQKAGHEKLLAAIKMADAFMDRMRPDAEEPLTDEERQAAFAAIREIGPLMEQERRYILEEVGREYGEDGAEFATYIQNVMDYTTPMPRMGRGRGPRHGGPGGPGGPGGGGPR